MKALRRWLRKAGARLDARRGLKSRDPFVVASQLVTRPAPVILDVGAHIGDTAAKYRSLFPDACIHCFEPFPESFERLVSRFADTAQTRLHRVAVTNHEGTVSLNVNLSDATNSTLDTDARGPLYWGDGKLETRTRIDVAATTIDRIRENERIEHVDILKIDVQGAEYSVLEGADATLRSRAIDIVYMELIVAPTYVGQRKLHEYLALLDSHGYVLFDFYNRARRNGRLIQADALFVSAPFLDAFETSTARPRAPRV